MPGQTRGTIATNALTELTRRHEAANADPRNTAHKTLFTGRRVPEDGTEFLVSTYFDADGEVIDQRVDVRPADVCAMWAPVAYLDPAPGTDPATGRLVEEPSC